MAKGFKTRDTNRTYLQVSFRRGTTLESQVKPCIPRIFSPYVQTFFSFNPSDCTQERSLNLDAF